MNQRAQHILRYALFIPIFFFALNVKAQNQKPMKNSDEFYDLAWKKIDSLRDKQLPQSALDEVNKVYQKAQKEGNSDQLVKALIHRMAFDQWVQESSEALWLKNLRAELGQASFPVKPLLHSMLGEMFWGYYEQNRYRIYDRTATVNFDPDDIETWDVRRLIEASLFHYKASLENPEALQKQALAEVYDEIIIPGGTRERQIRHSLYDFLAHRALQVFQSSEPSITRPAYAFEIDDLDFLAPRSEFIQLKLDQRDSLSFERQTLAIFQELLKIHMAANNIDSYLEADLLRLRYVYDNLKHEGKDESYEMALLLLSEDAEKSPLYTLVQHQLAVFYQKKGETYDPLSASKHQWDLKKAREIAEQAVQAYPESPGAKECQSLIQEIERKSLKIQVESLYPSGLTAPALIEFKNFDQLYWRLIPVKEGDEKAIEKSKADNYNQKIIKFYRQRKAVHTWETKLPDPGDHQTHRVEEKIPGLNLGKYIILASSSSELDYQGNVVAYTTIQVSNLSYIKRQDNNVGKKQELYILNRASGHPVVGARIEVFSRKYNYKSGRYVETKVGEQQSDKQGKVVILNPKKDKGGQDYQLKIYKDTDALLPVDNLYFYEYYNRDNLVRPKAHFFQDRKIYRPGQTVYFKAILISGNGEQNELLKNFKTAVSLYDVNGQLVKEQIFTSNDYGTISGSFQAPDQGLTGTMRLEARAEEDMEELSHTVASGETLYRIARNYNVSVQELKRWNQLNSDAIRAGMLLKVRQKTDGWSMGQSNFSVEEYKRPKFEVSFEPLEGSFRLNDTIKLVGKAKAYSGANIDGAEVTYTVTREVTLPYWWYYWRGFPSGSNSQQLSQGTATTDENGEFIIEFPAQPDLDFKKEDSPTFTFKVNADVTDLNGETRTGNTGVRVAYQALSLDLSVPHQIDLASEIKPWDIKSQNMAGIYQASQGSITARPLQKPERALKTRLWTQPDTFLYSQAEWWDALPNYPYKDEGNTRYWKPGEVVWEYNFNTEDTAKVLPPDLTQWPSGTYLFEIASKDSYGESVLNKYYVEVLNSRSKDVAIPSIVEFKALNTWGEPGEEAQLLVGSSESGVRVLYEVEHQGEFLSSEWLDVSREQRELRIPIKEEYRGNFTVYLTAVRGNRFYKSQEVIFVPRSDKKLDISLETFRDKLQPGQKEEWRLRVKGPQGEKVAAEMVATLYDASLDEFKSNAFGFNIYRSYYANYYWSPGENFQNQDLNIYQRNWNDYVRGYSYSYDELDWFGYSTYGYGFGIAGGVMLEDAVTTGAVRSRAAVPMMAKGGAEPEADEVERERNLNEPTSESKNIGGENPPPPPGKPENPEDDGGLGGVKARTNFQETAFFFPELKTDAQGEVILSFTIPEALTRWKLLGMAHTPDLKFGFVQGETLTQKDLMVVPNPPRFFREGDQIRFSAKVTNLSDKELEGEAQLNMREAILDKKFDEATGNHTPRQSFTLAPGRSTVLHWDLKIPAEAQALSYRAVAKAGKFSDGEEMTIPVLTNRMLVTETMPLPVRGNESKTFTMDKLLSSNESNTLQHQGVTLEFTSNPAWYAVQALPYLMEFPHECAEQLFSRVYANSLAAHIANSNPKIQAVFQEWKDISPDALLSNLDKNTELKSIILEETPWIWQANNEAERKRKIGLLFDLNRMGNELAKAVRKLKEKQVASGAWTWFEGMREDRYLTQHIVTGLGHLDHLGVNVQDKNGDIKDMLYRALPYLDRELQEDYQELLKRVKKGLTKLSDNHLGYMQIQYMYARSYFPEQAIPKEAQEALKYYQGQAEQYWTTKNRYMQGMIALALHRFDMPKTPQDIVKSLRERALVSEEMGMYWKSKPGYYWYQAPIETQALMVEVFDEVAQDTRAVDDLKTWLLKQKQTQDWKTTKATAEACYALLLRGENWLEQDPKVSIQVGNFTINPYAESSTQSVEAGTGYFQQVWKGEEVDASMGKVTVNKPSEGVAWGALYWQYFEQLDKITAAETPLKLKKQLFLQKASDAGPVLEPITASRALQVGDLVKVRIELRVDRMMEYVHMKDMRASGLEPINVLSGGRYQDGLYYYESTRDAATHFFMGYLPKGTYVFEYPLRVSQAGNFSNGVTSIQCMYAPEFASHSEGIRLEVKGE